MSFGLIDAADNFPFALIQPILADKTLIFALSVKYFYRNMEIIMFKLPQILL